MCEGGRIRDMHKCLRKIEMKKEKATEIGVLTVRKFKENFERVSKEGYEKDPSVIA